MKIGTMSIVVGGNACNAKCPFCVSKMTPKNNISEKRSEVDTTRYMRNVHKACRLAEMSGVNTVLITGKGEPSLYLDDVKAVLMDIERYKFPFVEFQTNGILLAKWLKEFKDAGNENSYRVTPLEFMNLHGVSTISISMVHYLNDANKTIYSNDYPDLAPVIKGLHEMGFSVRLSCIMLSGYIDNWTTVCNLVDYAQVNNVEQLTIRPVFSQDKDVFKFVSNRQVYDGNLQYIHDRLEEDGTLLMTLGHGAKVYDFHGQNVCLSNCLTMKPETDELRQIILFPDGHIRGSWQHPGFILL